MVPVLSAEQMRAADRRSIDEIGLPGCVLMENAGAAVARVIRDRWPTARRIAVLCGRGNNGGDGFVVARRLGARALPVLLAGRRSDLKGDAALHAAAYERSGGRTVEVPDETAWAAAAGALAESDLLVDALLGTGLREAPAGVVARAIAVARSARNERGMPVVAVDLPSGVASDAGGLGWPTIEADLTVALAALKWGHVLPPACDAAGALVLAEIGVPDPVLIETGTRLGLLEGSDVREAFPPRRPGGHKGVHGHVLVVAGSLGKSGAAVLAGLGALRAGAGLVTVATPAATLPLVAAGRAELMTEPLPANGDAVGPESLARALELADTRDAVVLGPGLGQGPGVREFVAGFLARCPRPLVLDADGLNALAALWAGTGPAPLARTAATVLTPHPGEMARLLGGSAADVQHHRVEAARRLAQATGAVAVLKGQRTVVADPTGRSAVNPTGNPGLATAGTGDVLAGVAGALLARAADAWLAATAAVYVHGLAGDRACVARGAESLLAGDVADALGDAIQALQRGDADAALARIS